MKSLFARLSSIFVLLFLSTIVHLNAQNVLVNVESFPNTFNTSLAGNTNSTFTGSIGTWGAFSNQSYASTGVVNWTFGGSSPNSLVLKNYKGPNASYADATSPSINLSAYSCSAGGSFVFDINADKLSSANHITTYKIEISNNGGSTWATVFSKTAAQLITDYPGGWNSGVYVAIPSSYMVSNFKYRISGFAAANSPYDSQLYFDDICLLVARCTPACVGNLLSNPGFESDLTSWDNWGNASWVYDPYSAFKAIQVTGGQGGFAQSVTGVPGNIYTFKYWAKKNGGTEDAIIGIKFFNSSWVVISEFNQLVTSTNYQEYTQTRTAPAGTAFVQIFAWKNAGSATLRADDFCLTTVTGNPCQKTFETFPNQFNTGFTAPINSTFVGSSGTWSANSSNSKSTVVVVTPYYSPSTSHAIKLVNNKTQGANTDTWSGATSPTINNTGNCCPNETKLNFTLWTYTCFNDDNNSFFNVEFSGDGGTTWYKALTLSSSQMFNLYGSNAKVNLSVPIATSLQTNNFKYRFSQYSGYETHFDFYTFVDDVSISSPAVCATGSIGNYVWNDANINGVQDAGESPIANVVVTLRDANGTIITTTTTNASGIYLFSNLPAGNYQVSFTTPAGFNPTFADQGGDDARDSDPIGGTIKNITLTTGQNRTDIDAGFFAVCATLFNETFPNTFNTTYTVPTNGTFTGNLGTWTVASNNNFTGLVVENSGGNNAVKTINYYDPAGALGRVTLTSPVLNLVQSTSCTQLVYLNFDIYPSFINSPVGSDAYKVYIDFSGNGGTTWSTAWSLNGADIVRLYGLGVTSPVTISIPGSAYTSNFRFRLRSEQQAGVNCDNYVFYDNFQIRKCPCPSLVLGNLVWEDLDNDGIKDTNESGLGGVTVRLYNDNNGDNIPDGGAIQTTTTNGSGNYSFTQLVPGNYIVGVVLPNGYVATATTGTSANPNNDTDNDNNGVTTTSGELRSNAITLTNGGEPLVGIDGDDNNGNLTLDFGVRNTNACVGNLLTNNGFESNLTSWNPNGAPWTISTDAFSGTKSAQISGTDGYLGQGVAGVVGNLYALKAFGKLTGGTEWASIGIEFLNASNVVISSEVLQVNSTNFKEYLISAVAPVGTVNVQVFGYKFTGAGTLKIDEFCLTTTPFTCATNLVLNPGLEAATDFQNWTKSGTPANVTITTDAYAGSRAAQIAGGDGGFYQQVSAAAGDIFVLKLFGKKTGGTEYTGFGLQFFNSSNVVLSETSTSFETSNYTEKTLSLTAPVGTSYINVWVWKNTGTAVYKVDEFNLCKTTPNANPLNLGNLVWYDINNNGIRDAGEPGIGNATVNLYVDANNDNVADGPAIATTVSNGSGNYNFTNLASNNYIVGVVIPNGYAVVTTNGGDPDNNTDNDNNGLNTVGTEIRSNAVTLSVGGEPASGVDGDGTNGNLTVDFAFRGILNLGNLVWIDKCVYGTKDASEVGFNNAVVNLYRETTGDNLPDGGVIATTNTDANGIYSFSNLAPGNYIVGVVLPNKYTNSATVASSANPNNNTDNDNNGVRIAGGILFSNSINLAVGAEPLAGVDGDGANGNLTLDFAIALDTDGDTIADIIDIDDDNDGITDVNESGGVDPLADCDADCVPNYLDNTPGAGCLPWADCNNDFINDNYDWDRDGIINSLDLDSDNDGIVDVQEARSSCASALTIVNGMVTGTDVDANGLLSTVDNGSGFTNQAANGLQPQDFDRDGRPNYLDLDSDGDGITDATESRGIYDSNGILDGADSDGDGVRGENFGSSAVGTADNVNGHGAKGITLLDSDGDGKPNAYDVDSDNDGITDNVEGQSTCGYVVPPASDCDADGVADAYDLGGCSNCLRTSGGITPFDKDGDGTPDYLDTDTDNDGAPDIYEGHSIPSPSGNVPPLNYWIGALGDADCDGLWDFFDGTNIITATSNFVNNVTHSNMGTGGGFDGPSVVRGSISQLPKSKTAAACNDGDRDWRDVTVLPVSLLNFKGNLNSNNVTLTWIVSREVNIDYYEVERSVDGITFSKIATIAATNTNTTATSTYTSNDNVQGFNAPNVYYRLRIVEKDGSAKGSNVISFKLNTKVKVGITINPNPAISFFNLKLTSTRDANAQINVVDMLGRILIKQNTKVLAGTTTQTFSNISNLSAGTYVVQVTIDGEVFNEKLIISK